MWRYMYSMESKEGRGWFSPENAEGYDTYTKNFPFYRATSRDLVEFAQLQKGMSVVDLGCGTGVTTREILNVLGTTNIVYAVDYSPSMCKFAKKNVRDFFNVEFIQAAAENFHQNMLEQA